MKTIDRRIIAMATVALMLAACSGTDDDGLNVSGLQPEIRFIPMVEGSTRALQTGSDISMEMGDKFYVWADQREEDEDTYTRAVFFNEWELAVQAGVNRIAASRETKRYPAMFRVQFYAIHGNFSGDHTSFDPNDDVYCNFPLTEQEYNEKFLLSAPTAADLKPLLHTVETDQRTQSGTARNKNYTKSDLLYAVVPEMTASNTAVPLNFYHMLSKIVVNLQLGKGLTIAELSTAEVKIKNVKTKVLFSPKKLKFANGAVETDDWEGVWFLEEASELGDIDIRSEMLSEPDVNPATATILLGTNVNESEVCILPPQAFSDDAVIEVTWNDKVLTIPLKDGEIKSGMVYTYDITVDHVGTGYSFNPTVSNWGSSGQREIDVTE